MATARGKREQAQTLRQGKEAVSLGTEWVTRKPAAPPRSRVRAQLLAAPCPGVRGRASPSGVTLFPEGRIWSLVPSCQGTVTLGQSWCLCWEDSHQHLDETEEQARRHPLLLSFAEGQWGCPG